MSHSVQRRWYPIAFAIAALVLLPLSVLLLSWHEVDGEIWAHLWDTQMPRLLGNTLLLVSGVSFGVVLLGVSLAWLTSLCEFPGRRWLDWALMLPFAIPAYVLAFVFVGLLDFAGPLQTLAREWFGSGIRFPRVRSSGGVAPGRLVASSTSSTSGHRAASASWSRRESDVPPRTVTSGPCSVRP